MIKILPFLQIFFILNAHSLEIECRFEEVYSDSTVQNGFLLIKGDKLRYEYYSENLFTLFHNNNSGDLTVRMEKNHSGDFLKRVSIRSPNINMSLYFNQCNTVKISDRYFSHNPYFKYR